MGRSASAARRVRKALVWLRGKPLTCEVCKQRLRTRDGPYSRLTLVDAEGRRYPGVAHDACLRASAKARGVEPYV